MPALPFKALSGLLAKNIRLRFKVVGSKEIKRTDNEVNRDPDSEGSSD